MNRRHLFRLTTISSMGLAAVLGACKLGPDDVPAPAQSTKASAGDGGTRPPPSSNNAPAEAGAPLDGSAASPPKANAPADAGAPAKDNDAGAPAADTTPPSAPSAPAPLWAAPPEVARVLLSSAADEKCAFELSYVVETPETEELAQYTLTLEKRDVSASSCAEPKGIITLATHSYALPAGLVRRHATDPLIAVAWTEKPRPEAETQSAMRLAQIDWATGTNLHDAKMFVKGTPADAVPAQPLVPTSMNLSVGFDVIVSGTGQFPGATGTGDSFEATWVGFLGTTPQAPSPADSATQQ